MAAAEPEPEAALVHASFPSLFRPETEVAKTPCRHTAPEVAHKTEDGAEGGPAGIVPVAGLPAQGDSPVEDGPPASVDEEPACSDSAAEAECLLPQSVEEGKEGPAPTGQPEGSWRTETGHRPPVGIDEGSREYVCLWEEEEEEEDQAPGSSTQEAASQSFSLQVEGPEDEAECPICTEPYDQGGHLPALLNCGHTLCAGCLRAILEAASAADIGRVRCPICRQKTPMVEWEICRLQEELMLLSAAPDPASAGPPVASFSPLPARRPGFWGGLEHHFQVRFRTTRMVGFLPCLRYPPRLIGGLDRLERNCPGGYRLALLGLLLAELLSLLLVFLPIGLLLLLFLILER